MQVRSFLLLLSMLTAVCLPLHAEDHPALKLVMRVELPGVKGRFDHMAVDVKGQRLFMAALGNNTVEVIDVREGKRLRSLSGFQKPTGIAYLADQKRFVVASGNDGCCRIFDADSMKLIHKVSDLDDADNVRYDAATKLVYVGYGSGALAVIQIDNGRKVSDIQLGTHPESFRLEDQGSRIFVNVPESHEVAVTDRMKKVVARWPVKESSANFPMYLDEQNHRLFIGCRQPPQLVIYDTESGKQITSTACVGDTDDLFYDSKNHRIYVSGGAGAVTVIKQIDADQYELLGEVKTAAGARTSLFSQELEMLFVAAPAQANRDAQLLIYRAEKEGH